MFGKLVRQVEKSTTIPLIGDGSQIQYLVHQEDLCAFIEKFAAGRVSGTPPLLTAAHPQPWPFKQLLLEIARASGRRVHFLPVPWRLVWLALKSTEFCGLPLNFRSDSLVGLMYPNPAPNFAPNKAFGLACRPFQAGQ